MSSIELKSSLENILDPLLTGMGFELVDLDWRSEPTGWVLRLYIDKALSGVSIKDCETVSRSVDKALENMKELRHAYALEVSSPGLRRPLRRLNDFTRFKGQKACVELKAPLPGTQQRVFHTILGGADPADGKVWLEEETGKRFAVSLEAIEKAALEPEIKV